MTRHEFELIVRNALKEFPGEFRDKLQNIDIVIEKEPDMEMVMRLGLGGKGRILGLYQGVPIKDRTHYYGMVMPDKITLFMNNIELAAISNKFTIPEQVKHVIEHEIAHHFGISDKRLTDLGLY